MLTVFVHWQPDSEADAPKRKNSGNLYSIQVLRKIQATEPVDRNGAFQPPSHCRAKRVMKSLEQIRWTPLSSNPVHHRASIITALCSAMNSASRSSDKRQEENSGLPYLSAKQSIKAEGEALSQPPSHVCAGLRSAYSGCNLARFMRA